MPFEIDSEHHCRRKGTPADEDEDTARTTNRVARDEGVKQRTVERVVATPVVAKIDDQPLDRLVAQELTQPSREIEDALVLVVFHCVEL